jgi:hypothetical protein
LPRINFYVVAAIKHAHIITHITTLTIAEPETSPPKIMEETTIPPTLNMHYKATLIAKDLRHLTNV